MNDYNEILHPMEGRGNYSKVQKVSYFGIFRDFQVCQI